VHLTTNILFLDHGIIKTWDIENKSIIKKICDNDNNRRCCIFNIQCSPDSNFITAVIGTNIKKWSIPNCKLILSIENAHTSYVGKIDYSINDKYIVSFGNDDNIKIWNAESGSLLKCIKVSSPRSVCYSSNKKYIIVETDPNIQIFCALNWELINVWPTGYIWDISCSENDNDTVYVNGANGIKMLNIKTGKIIKTLTENIFHQMNMSNHRKIVKLKKYQTKKNELNIMQQ